MRTLSREILFSLTVLPSVVGCGGDPGNSQPNVILISLDTLRADRLSTYGYVRDTSPNIDALAKEGVVFEHAFAEAPWTLPSHVTMLTGLYPATHGANLPSRILTEDTSTLAEALNGAGYSTVGLTEGGFIGYAYGFSKGFDTYSENRPDLDTTLETVRQMLPELRAAGPFFLFLHTFDIHCPYEPPAAHERLFRTYDEDPIEFRGTCGSDFNALELTAGQISAISNRYDAGIHSVDALLGTFLSELESEGILDNTFVILTSDHGEQLYEHGRIGHERSVNREVLHVPWIVCGPEVVPRRITAPVGLVDMTPTILDLVGLGPLEGNEGESRAPWLRGEAVPSAAEEAPRFSQLTWRLNLQSVMTKKNQLIIDPRSDETTLFEFPSPSAETRLQSGSYLERELREALDEHLDRASPREASERRELDTEETERLKTLGYGH